MGFKSKIGKKIHIFQKKKGEKTRIPCVSLERLFRFTEEIFKKVCLIFKRYLTVNFQSINICAGNRV